MKAKIHIVSQNLEIIKTVSSALETEGHKVSSSNSAENCLKQCKVEQFDIVFVDVHLHGLPYNQLISDIKKVLIDTEIIVITSYAFPDVLIKAENRDISSFIIQPLEPDKVRNAVNRALRQSELIKENRRLLLAITAAKKEWEATVDAIEDPIFVTDFDYNILRANLATFQKLNKGVNEVLGHKCFEIFHCANNPLDECPGKKARDSGEPITDTIFFKGLKQRFTSSIYPQVFAAGGGLVHYLQEPVMTTEQQAETMTKYERMFDDAALPVIFIDLEDYKILDANYKALELFGRDPEKMLNTDLEDLFVESMRESTLNGIIKQTEGQKVFLKSKVLVNNKDEIDVYVVANPIEIKGSRYVEIFLIPKDVLKE